MIVFIFTSYRLSENEKNQIEFTTPYKSQYEDYSDYEELESKKKNINFRKNSFVR
jgi:hypothetical protein